MEIVFSDIIAYAVIFLTGMFVSRVISGIINPQTRLEMVLGSLAAVLCGMLAMFWLYTLDGFVFFKPASASLTDPANVTVIAGFAIAYLVRQKIF